MGKKIANKEGKINMFNMIKKIAKVLVFDTMEDDEGANSKEHAYNCILESEMKTS